MSLQARRFLAIVLLATCFGLGLVAIWIQAEHTLPEKLGETIAVLFGAVVLLAVDWRNVS